MGNMAEAKKMSQRRQTKDALGRIETLEQTIPQIVQGVNGALTQTSQHLNLLQEALDAVIELVGDNAVQEKIEEIRVRRAEAAVEAQKSQIVKALKDGTLVETKVVGEKSLVIGAEADKDGKVTNGRVQLPLHGVRPEFREKLLGQAVGFKLELPNGGSFSVNEIYDVTEKEPEAPSQGDSPMPADGGCDACNGNCQACEDAQNKPEA